MDIINFNSGDILKKHVELQFSISHNLQHFYHIILNYIMEKYHHIISVIITPLKHQMHNITAEPTFKYKYTPNICYA